MKKLTLHSGGSKTHTKLLKQKVKKEILEVEHNIEITEEERVQKVKELRERFSEDARKANRSLF